MKNFTQKFIGILALLFATSISVNAQCVGGLDWDLLLLDSYGDGWNGATLSISNCNGDVLLDGVTFDDGDEYLQDVCLPISDGYTIGAGGGDYDGEISWRLIESDGSVHLEGGSGDSVSSCPGWIDVNTPIPGWSCTYQDLMYGSWIIYVDGIYSCDSVCEENPDISDCLTPGCTDANALNFNIYATTDDGSCDYCEFEEVATQSIPVHLPVGWSMFGYTCIDSVDAMVGFSSISDKIEIVKDEWGLSYIPSWEFNAMGSLQFSEGYQIKMIEEVDGFQFCSSVLPDDGIGQADLDAVQTELAIALESLSDLTEQMGEIELSYSGEDILYISEFVNSLLLDVSALLDSDALDLNSLTELAENYLTPGIAYLTDNSLVTDEEVSLLYDILFDIAAIVANQEDGITQVDVDAAYADGAASVDITSDNQAAFDEGAASVTPEDGVSQADVDEAVAEVEASYAGYTAPLDLQIGDIYEGGYVFYIDETGEHGLVAAMEDSGQMSWYDAMNLAANSPYWLPTIEELELMYNTIGQGADNVGGFADDWYWSSTEEDVFEELALGILFGTDDYWNSGNIVPSYKTYTDRVRIIHAF